MDPIDLHNMADHLAISPEAFEKEYARRRVGQLVQLKERGPEDVACVFLSQCVSFL